jgi:hypothetical protein
MLPHVPGGRPRPAASPPVAVMHTPSLARRGARPAAAHWFEECVCGVQDCVCVAMWQVAVGVRGGGRIRWRWHKWRARASDTTAQPVMHGSQPGCCVCGCGHVASLALLRSAACNLHAQASDSPTSFVTCASDVHAQRTPPRAHTHARACWQRPTHNTAPPDNPPTTAISASCTHTP